MELANSLLLIPVAAVGVFLVLLPYSPFLQGIIVFFPVPYFWIDFTKPHKRQFLFSGLSNTLNFYLHNGPVRLGVWHKLPDQYREQKVGEALGQEEKREKRVVFYLHGNGESRAYWKNLPKYNAYTAAPYGAHLVTLDYRGYGDSSGYPHDEDSVFSDVMTVWNWIVTPEQEGGLGAKHAHVLVHGHSLGSAFAIRLCKELTEAQQSAAGLVLEAPFTKPSECVTVKFPSLQPYLSGCLVHDFPSIDRIAAVDCPVFLCHGARDSIVPCVLSERLFLRRVAEREKVDTSLVAAKLQMVSPDPIEMRDTTYVSVENGAHDDLMEYPQVEKALRRFWSAIFPETS